MLINYEVKICSVRNHFLCGVSNEFFPFLFCQRNCILFLVYVYDFIVQYKCTFFGMIGLSK